MAAGAVEGAAVLFVLNVNNMDCLLIDLFICLIMDYLFVCLFV